MNKPTADKTQDLQRRQKAPLATPSDLQRSATADIAGALNAILADVFALYLKTKNFHWHMSGPHFRDYHLLLDEQADQLFAMTDPIAERIRKIGGTTLRSIGHIARTAARPRQRRRVRRAARHARRAARGQQDARGAPARGARRVRRASRHRDGQPDRSLDRRDRAPHLVPVRGEPSGRFERPLSRPSRVSPLRPFRHRAFAVVWTATLVANVGVWMQKHRSRLADDHARA